MIYELWDTSTGVLVDESDSIDALSEVKADLLADGTDTASLQILENVNGERVVVVE